MSILGLDHGVGHPLLFLGKAKEHKYRNSKDLKNLDNYPEWPKVADAAIETLSCAWGEVGIPFV
jgi:hypothetical protein